MKDLFASLQDNFTIVNLGCIGDEDFLLPQKFLKTLTIVEIDAEGGAVTGDRYRKKITSRNPSAGARAGTFSAAIISPEPVPCLSR